MTIPKSRLPPKESRKKSEMISRLPQDGCIVRFIRGNRANRALELNPRFSENNTAGEPH